MPIFQHYKTFQTKFHNNKRNLHFNKIDANAHIQKLFLIFPNDFFFYILLLRPLFILSETIPFICRGVDFHLNFGENRQGSFKIGDFFFERFSRPSVRKISEWNHSLGRFLIKICSEHIGNVNGNVYLICSHRCIEIHFIGSFRIFMKKNLMWKFWVGVLWNEVSISDV